jgi:hypothetical protein
LPPAETTTNSLNAVALVAVAEAAVVAVVIAQVPLAPTEVDRKEAAGVADWL